ncbi:MAG: glycosyltransferase [Paludibacteraceae bacterium]|nr:glycosyltransferase [Paludibacteraceae bacterium]
MRICILGTAYPYRGGLATFNERLARQLTKEGHKVNVLTFTVQYPDFLFPGKTQYTSDPAPTDLSIKRCLNACNPINWIQVGKKIKKDRPDILITCYWMAFFAPAYSTIQRIVHSNRHTRCIALVHNMLPHEPSLLDKLFAPCFVKQTDAFIALSDSVIADIESFDKQHKPKVASPHPIYDHYGERVSKQEACRQLNIESDNDYMLFFGLVRAYKGLDLLLDAFHRVKEQLPQLRLIIAGEFYEDEHKYRTQIDQLQLSDRIILRNEFIPDSEMPLYFGAADIIVQPYKTATQSGVTQVAFQFEKPMLVTNVGGLAEIVHHGKMGYTVPPSPQPIAEAITDYFTCHRQTLFTQYLQQEKCKYGWDRFTAALLSLYKKIQ